MHVSTIVNLMPHDFVLYQEVPSQNGTRYEEAFRIPSEGKVARLQSTFAPRELVVNGRPIPAVATFYDGTTTGIPAPREGVLYIVSRLVALSVRRPDFVFPDGEIRRDGVVIGCRRLSFMEDDPSNREG